MLLVEKLELYLVAEETVFPRQLREWCKKPHPKQHKEWNGLAQTFGRWHLKEAASWQTEC